MKKEMCRISDGKMAEGIFGGFAKYFGIDVSIVCFNLAVALLGRWLRNLALSYLHYCNA